MYQFFRLEVTPEERGCPTVVMIPVRSRTAVSYPLPENSGGDRYTLRAGNLRAIKSCQQD